MVWLHEQGYQFVGPARIGKLTPHELTVLQCGFMVREQAKEDEIDDARVGHGHSKGRAETRKLAEQRARGSG